MFEKPVFIQPNIVKGQIKDLDCEGTYDNDGNRVLRCRVDLGDETMLTAMYRKAPG